jgi:hypothetical protein
MHHALRISVPRSHAGGALMFGFAPLSPVFLWGLGAVSVPVIIHLMHSPRARQIDFPSVRFLLACQKKATRRSRLKNIILLLLRMLLIALLAWALSRPYRENEQTDVLPDAPVSMVVILDNSYSMGYVAKGVSHFERAREAAISLLDTLKPGDEVAVLLMNEKVEPCFKNLTTDLDRVRTALRGAELSARGTNADPALREALRVVARAGSAAAAAELSVPGAEGKQAEEIKAEVKDEEAQRRRRQEIHVLTDLQDQAWEPVIKSGFLKTVETKATIHVSNFGRAGAPNVYLTKATVQSGGPEEATVTARVRASGAGPPGNIITLNVNGKNETQETFAVRPGQPVSVPLSARFGEAGTYRCVLTLQEDALAVDDRHYFTVEVGERSRVLVVDGDPSAVPHLSETFYLSAALNPGGPLGGEGVSAVDAKVVSLAKLSGESLDDLRCLILCNAGGVDGSDLARIEDFLRKGGGVLIFCGDRTTAQEYNAWEFLPLTLTQPVGDSSKRTSFTMGEQRGDHPVFERDIDLRAARFFMCYGSNRFSVKDGGRVLASFNNGQPALVEAPFGRGKVLLFTSSCDLDWSNLPLRRAFLPWVYQMIYYLSNQETTASAFTLDEPVKFQALAAQYKQPITVIDPEGNNVVLRPQIRGGYAEAVYDQTTQPGLYQVSADAAFSHSGGFGVNLDVAKESVMETASQESIEGAARPGLVRFIDAPGRSVVEEVKRSREGEELWPLLFKLALLVFIIESLFGNLAARARKAGGFKLPLFEVLKQRTPGIESAGTTSNE